MGEGHSDTLRVLIGSALRSQGKLDESERTLREAVTGRKRVLGNKHPDTLGSMFNLGLVLYDQERYGEYGQIFREVLDLRIKVQGKEHPGTLSSVKMLGRTLYCQKLYGEATRIAWELLGLREKVQGKEHAETLEALRFLAKVCYVMGGRQASQLFHQLLESREKVLGKEHLGTISSMYYLGCAICREGKYEEAQRLLQETWTLGKKLARITTSRFSLGEMFRRLGRRSKGGKQVALLVGEDSLVVLILDSGIVSPLEDGRDI